jgi:hypothetical protein
MNPGGGRVRDLVEVCCYAGGRGEETPRAVLLGGREVTVRVERSWIEEPVGSGGTDRRRMFQVRLEDGRRCRLAQEPDGSWTLAHTASGRKPLGPALVRGAARRMVGPVTSGARFA